MDTMLFMLQEELCSSSRGRSSTTAPPDSVTSIACTNAAQGKDTRSPQEQDMSENRAVSLPRHSTSENPASLREKPFLQCATDTTCQGSRSEIFKPATPAAGYQVTSNTVQDIDCNISEQTTAHALKALRSLVRMVMYVAQLAFLVIASPSPKSAGICITSW
jgi:hypothetical protein